MHFNTIVAVYDGVMYEADNAYSIRSTWLCYRQVRFFTVAYSAKQFFFCFVSFSPSVSGCATLKDPWFLEVMKRTVWF